jgi:glycosyltransferase involved in cell wall biosynthesis
MNELVVFCKGDLKKFPPIISLIHYTNRLKINVVLVCSSCSQELKENLNSQNLMIIESNLKKVKKNNRISEWVNFHKKSWDVIKKYPKAYIWISTGDTALALGYRIIKKEYSLQLLELYDKFPIYKIFLKKIAKKAKVVIVPENNRANIIKVWWKLNALPIVIPNKPLIHSRVRNLELKDESLNKLITKLKSKKIILYQGLIYKERNLIEIAKALNALSQDFVLLLLGSDIDGSLENLIKINPNLIHIPFVTPPDHLNITSHAYIGIATYDDSSLNNVFCAPNKIYEYSGFSIPMLCRDIPGLKYTVDVSNAGICVDTDNQEEIINAIISIDKSYDTYSKNSYEFYDLIDIENLFNKALIKLEN